MAPKELQSEGLVDTNNCHTNCHTCSADPKDWRICVKKWGDWIKRWFLSKTVAMNGLSQAIMKFFMVLILSGILILFAKWMCGHLFWNDPNALWNSTLFIDDPDNASTKATLLGVVVNVIVTCTLIVVTAFYASDTHSMLKQGRDKQRTDYIIYCLENFYFPAQSILEDDQYICDKLIPKEAVRNYKKNEEKYKQQFVPPNPHILASPQALLYHVQMLELKELDLKRYCASKTTLKAYSLFTSMETFNKNFKEYQQNFPGLLKLVKKDHDHLLGCINEEINSLQNELDDLVETNRSITF